MLQKHRIPSLFCSILPRKSRLSIHVRFNRRYNHASFLILWNGWFYKKQTHFYCKIRNLFYLYTVKSKNSSKARGSRARKQSPFWSQSKNSMRLRHLFLVFCTQDLSYNIKDSYNHITQLINTLWSLKIVCPISLQNILNYI